MYLTTRGMLFPLLNPSLDFSNSFKYLAFERYDSPGVLLMDLRSRWTLVTIGKCKPWGLQDTTEAQHMNE